MAIHLSIGPTASGPASTLRTDSLATLASAPPHAARNQRGYLSIAPTASGPASTLRTDSLATLASAPPHAARNQRGLLLVVAEVPFQLEALTFSVTRDPFPVAAKLRIMGRQQLQSRRDTRAKFVDN